MMTAIKDPVPSDRLVTLDIFRGLMVILMFFANSTVKGVPWWLHHFWQTPGTLSLTYVDFILPGFIFIIGASVPLALARRLQKEPSLWKLSGHILLRVFLLLWLGALVTVTNQFYRPELVGMTVAWWKVLGYAAAIILLVPAPALGLKKPWQVWMMRGIGLTYLIWSSLIFRGGSHGGILLNAGGTAQEWLCLPPSILGILAKVYLVACLAWLCSRHSPVVRLAIYGLLILYAYNLSPQLKPLCAWLDPWTFGRMASLAVAGTLAGDLFLRQSGNGFGRINIRVSLLAMFSLLVVAAILAGASWFRISSDKAYPFLAASVCVGLLWLIWETEVAFKRRPLYSLAISPFAGVGRNALLGYMLPPALAGLVILVTGTAFIGIDGVDVSFQMQGWSGLFLCTLPWTIVLVVIVLLANRRKLVMRL